MDNRKQVTDAIRDYLARGRISREEFVAHTKLGKSTIDKLLIGIFSERTLAIVESKTNLALRAMLDGAVERPRRPIDMPSVAVLPFANLGGDQTSEFIADGLTEDIIAALTRLRWLLVIDGSSAFTYKGREIGVRQVGQELGVSYVLEGSIRTAGTRLRTTTQLIDSDTGRHLWAEKYDHELKDIFAIKDEIADRVVAAVEPRLYAEENARASTRRPENFGAWELVVRALSLLRHIARKPNEEAQALLRRAIVIEPNYARPHALLGWACWWAAHCYWCADWVATYAEASEHAKTSVQLDPDDPWGRMSYGLCLSTAGQLNAALTELRAALALNPSFAMGRMVYGWVLARAGHFDEAIVETEKALRLSPTENFSGLYKSIHGLALLSGRRFEEALVPLQAVVAEFVEDQGYYNLLISCCGHLGLVDDAREFIAARNRIGPPLRIGGAVRQRLAPLAYSEVFIEGLQKAGVPE